MDIGFQTQPPTMSLWGTLKPLSLLQRRQRPRTGPQMRGLLYVSCLYPDMSVRHLSKVRSLKSSSQKILINPTCAQRHRDHSERTGEREMWGSPTSGSNQLGQRPMEADHLLLLGGSKMHSSHSSEAQASLLTTLSFWNR